MIEIKNCTKIYKNGIIGVKNINLVLPTTGLICFYGKENSGKSTLINCLSGLDEFSSGEIYIDNIKAKDLSDYSSFAFQEYKLIENLTVYENLLVASSNEYEINELLKKFDIIKLKDQKINTLSNTQCKKIEILKAIVQKSSIVLCDEPIKNIDDGTEEIIISILKELSYNRLIIISSSNEALLRKYADGLIEIENAEITFNTINATNEISSYKKSQENIFSNKLAFKLAKDNIKNNKLKATIALMFTFMSLITLSLILTILCINLPQVLYRTYTSEKTVAVFGNKENIELSDYQIQSSNSDLILYDIPNGLTIKSQDDYSLFYKIYVANWSFAKRNKLDSTHIIVNDDIYNSLSKKTLYYLDYSFDLIKESNECKKLKAFSQNYLIVTKDVFDIIKYKAYNIDTITLDNNNTLKKYQLHNNFYSTNSNQLIPNDNEIILSYDYINDLNLNKNDIIGSTIKLKFSTNIGNENNDGTISFKVIGAHENFVFSDKFFNKIYSSNYDMSSTNKACVYLNHSLKNFINADKLNLKPIDNLGITIIDNYTRFHNILPYLSIAFGLFLIGLILTLISITSSSINQDKKTLGILLSFNIKQKLLPKIYMCENLFICFISWIISLLIYFPIIIIINIIIQKQCDISINYVTGSVSIFIILIIFIFIVVFIGSIIPIKKLLSKSKFEMLYEA